MCLVKKKTIILKVYKYKIQTRTQTVLMPYNKARNRREIESPAFLIYLLDLAAVKCKNVDRILFSKYAEVLSDKTI